MPRREGSTQGFLSRRSRGIGIAAAVLAVVAGAASPSSSEGRPTHPPSEAPGAQQVVHLHGDHLVRGEDGVARTLPEQGPWPSLLARSAGELGSSTEGFSSWNDLSGNVGTYRIHLVTSPDVEELRPGLVTVAGELSSITGEAVTVAPGQKAIPNGSIHPDPGDNEIHVVVSALTPCNAPQLIGCGEIRFRNGVGHKGTVWVTPAGMGLSTDRRTSLLRHEVGHVLGLRHYQPTFEGSRQVMASSLAEAVPYGSGDRNGIRFLDPTCRNRPVDVGTGNPFCEHIAWTTRNGIVNGWPDGTFRPAVPISRQAMAVMLHRYAGSPPPGSTPPIVDLPPDPDFASAISWLVSEGIATGDADGRFRPTDPVSRQAMAAFLHRYLKWANPSMGDGPPGRQFNDVPAGHAFEVQINSLAYLDVVQGTLTGAAPTGYVFDTTSPVTRQAVAAFFFRSDNL